MAFILTLQGSESAIQATCKTEVNRWYLKGQIQNLTTCRLQLNEIDGVNEEDFTILPEIHLKVPAFTIFGEEKVKFLPTNLNSVLPDLIVMRICSCHLTTIKRSYFKNLSNLLCLELESNEIEHISSDAFADLFRLEILEILNNRIQYFEENTFASLKALIELNLYGNGIHTLNSKDLGSLVNLEAIYLERNNLYNLSENAFENLINLKKISLSSNALFNISKNLFEKNLKLEEIDLSWCHIQIIDPNMFDHLSILRRVDFTGNLCTIRDFDGKSGLEVGNYHSDNFNAMKEHFKLRCYKDYWYKPIEKSVKASETDDYEANVDEADHSGRHKFNGLEQ